jgi:DNA-binding CsgD family transcriptional regulator
VWQGRYDDARREVDTGLDLLAFTGDPELAARIAAAGVRVEADLAEATRRAGGRPAGRTPLLGRRGGADDDGPEARGGRLIAELERLAATAALRHAPPSSEARASLLTGQGELSRLTGKPDPGRWQEAGATWDAIGFTHCAAYTRFRRAEAALATGDAPTGQAELTAAWETAQRLGAAPLAGAVERLGRRARIDLGAPAGAAAAVADGGPPLTPRESEVLALVAEGRTNRQIGEVLFISEKTASVHVSRLLAKLGASNRAEAAAAARRLGLLAD